VADAADVFVEGLDEVLEQILVAGLARPPAGLADDLAELAVRADAVGVRNAADGLRALRSALHDPDAGWAATQRLLCWRDLFTRSLTLDRVEDHMAKAAEVEPTSPRRRAGFTGRVFCHGFAFDEVGRLTLYATDIDGGADVVVADRLSDHDPDDLLGRPAISRLLQASVSVRRVVDGLLCFEDHPFATRRGRVELAPAFREIPVVRDVAPGFEAPDAVEHTVARLDERGWLLPDGTPLFESEVLRLNLTKLRIHDAHFACPVALRAAGGEAHLLHAIDPDEGRVFPAHDPALFRPSADFLRARSPGPVYDALVEGRPLPVCLPGRTPEIAGQARAMMEDPDAMHAFIEAHTDSWRRPDAPLPTPREMLCLADLRGGPLDLPRLRVAQTCATALLRREEEAAAVCYAARAGVLRWLVA